MKKYVMVIALLLAVVLCACKQQVGSGNANEAPEVDKPVIYLYPEHPMDVHVELVFDGTLTTTYPRYRSGWNVTAEPDGTLTDMGTGRTYYCLFWEGVANKPYEINEGFVVAGTDTAAFLEDALEKLGLTEKEANEFIIYWLPRMEGNAYNLICFQQEQYIDSAVLKIEPQPDSILRVFMTWKALEEPVEIKEQILTSLYY